MTMVNPAQNTPPMKVQINIRKDKTILGDLKFISQSDLQLDPKNVRFKHLDRILTDEEIESWIGDESDTRSLLKEIRFSNGLSELPFVQEISDGKYRVVEGNRRTVCMRKIASDIKSGDEKDISLEAVDPVQCIVFPKDVSEKLLAVFLARIHVSGKKEWDAFNQSGHVYDLVKKHDFDYDDVTKAVSIGKSRVKRMLSAYEATQKYREKFPDDNMWMRRYSHFEELFNKKVLKEWAEEPLNLEQFMKWVHSNQFPMAIKVRKLAAIIEDGKDAYLALKKGAVIDDAAELLKRQTENRTLTAKIADDVEDTVKGFQELVENFPRGKMKELAKHEEKLQNLKIVYKDLGRLIKEIENYGGS